jgi:hypothetical protein
VDNQKPKIVVYTAQVGGLDTPRKDILCFKENNGFKESRRAARMYKILSHRFVDADYSIWCDNLIYLKKKPEELINLLDGKDIAVMRHPSNTSIYDEAKDIKKAKLDSSIVVDAQTSYYKSRGYNSNDGFAMTGLIIRKHTKEIEELNNQWWAELSSGSLRDQLSFNYVFDGSISYIDWPGSYDNEYFYRMKHRLTLLYKIKAFVRFRTRLKILIRFFK